MSDDYVKIDGHPGLVKDTVSGVVLNTDMTGLEAAKRKKQALSEEKKRLNKLENDVSEIKRLLEKLVNDN